ncbi:primosomal protein N' [Endozoicomonas elysicola]|uniref:primosomal protein N' n=1 Tax=Endozoicomonas elysicola TaxID=305900 RepID=UPI0003676335|nr:primosomal protein N' [Endozoicomonas elysicola]
MSSKPANTSSTGHNPAAIPTEPFAHKQFIRVAIPSPLRQLFDYLPPDSYPAHGICPGSRVVVPFGPRQVVAIVLSIEPDTDIPTSKLKTVISVLDNEPLLPNDIIHLCQWAARYYHHSLGETLAQAMPKNLRLGKPASYGAIPFWNCIAELDSELQNQLKRSKKQLAALELISSYPQGISATELHELGFSKSTLKELSKKGLICSRNVEPSALPFTDITNPLKAAHLKLNEEQAFACEAITDGLENYRTYLLEGVTGSGKTEVYLQAISAALSEGKQTLVLVPEIGLTPQTVRRFRDRFNVPVACLHSGLSDGERLQGWLEAARGSAGILISTRSGIFTPMPHLGLIIVDEEHDGSYKQQESLRYNARDLAIYRGRQRQCPVVLGSATPSLESLHNTHQGKYTQLHLKQRAGNARPPVMELLDLRHQVLRDGLSTELLQRMAAHLGRGNQVMVFLNRRGYAPSMICQDCGNIIDCPHCDAHMTIHRYPPHMHCHHCDLQQAIPWQCTSCQSRKLQPVGQGTERTEQVLSQHFADYPVLRIDRDTTRRKQALSDMLEEVQSGKACILLGTQMLAKGHHFPDVTLVAIINADAGLFSADFRGPERTGQLIMQVAGRAGRGDKPGQVIIQTYNPEHPALQLLSMNDYSRFTNNLFIERKQLNLPPEGYLTLIRSESVNQNESEVLLSALRQYAEQSGLQQLDNSLRILGPIPAPMEKRQGRYRWHLLIHGKNRNHLHSLVGRVVSYLESHRLPRQLKWTVDIDPQEMS